MGFFSAVKKIFGSKEQSDTKEQETLKGNILDESSHNQSKQKLDEQDVVKQEIVKQEIVKEEIVKQEIVKEELAKEEQIPFETSVEFQSEQVLDKSSAQPSQDNASPASAQHSQDNASPASAQHSQDNALDAEDADFHKLTLALRSTESKLSSWLAVTLENVEEADALFWKRLSYLLKALETPQEEADTFCREFKVWLERMDYYYLNDFRSELQYRLALALDLEDEEDERDRLFLKVQQGLERTRNQLGKGLQGLFASHDKLGESFFEELEELFIMSDMGAELSLKLVAKLREHARANKIEKASELLPYLQEEIGKLFQMPKRINVIHSPEVVLMVGVNGVGKTTTIAKLAYRAKMQGKKVLIAGADTFRAAAVEQLETWANRIGADFYSKGNGTDPAAVAYEAMDKALAGNYDILFIDTAGRLHNKSNLMDELHKIRNVIGKKHAGAPHRSILVIDATTGQNALQQTKVFKESGGVDEIILTKLDGTAKGGVALSVASMFEVPITFIGLGEKMEDLRPFHSADFAKALFGEREE